MQPHCASHSLFDNAARVGHGALHFSSTTVVTSSSDQLVATGPLANLGEDISGNLITNSAK